MGAVEPRKSTVKGPAEWFTERRLERQPRRAERCFDVECRCGALHAGSVYRLALP